MESIFSYRKSSEPNLYDLLGCSLLSTVSKSLWTRPYEEKLISWTNSATRPCDHNLLKSDLQTEQILTEYKVRALSLHPDKNLGDPLAEVRFKELHHAKEILLNPKSHKMYDSWLNMGLAIPFSDFMALGAGAHTSFHWASTSPRVKFGMISDGQNEENMQNDIMMDGSGGDVRLNPMWQRDGGSDLLDMFRKYEI